MKVLHIITSLELGGAEKLIGDLIPAQKKEGVDAQLLVLDLNGEVFLKEFEEKGIKVYKTKVNNRKSWKNIFEIRKIVKENNFDVVHTHLIHSQIWGAFAQKFLSGKRFLTTEHSTYNRRRGKKLLKYLDKFIYSAYEKIICISEATAQGLIEWTGVSKKKVEVIFNGVLLDGFLGKKRERKGNKLIMVSRFHETKDHLTVVRALKRLPKEYTLTFVGTGDTEEKVRKEVMMLGLDNRVQFLGFSNSVSSLLKRHDIAIQSSYFEGFGISALEAMATGTPTIASDIKGLSEVVSDGGLLFEQGNEEDLVKKVISLENEEFYKEISEKGIKKSLSFSIRNTAKEYIKLY